MSSSHILSDMCTETIVIGGGLTGLTTALHLSTNGHSTLLLESSDRTGGQIQTLNINGFIVETGPNTGVVSCPEVAELFDLLSSYCALEVACPAAKKRLIWKGNRFEPLPGGLWQALRTPLFSWKDKIGILAEPFRSRGTDPDESVAQLTARRLGQSFLEYAVDPFLSGVYAGNPETLITRHALPKLYRLEQEHGSFIRGAFAKAFEKKTMRDRRATKQVFSVTGGLGNLIHAITKRCGENVIRTQCRCTAITPQDDHWTVTYTDGEGRTLTTTARQVVFTGGAHALAGLLPFVSPTILQQLTTLQYAPVIQVAVAGPQKEEELYRAFGGLVPSVEQRQVLGILFPSACFTRRAPKGKALYAVFMGGMRHTDLFQRSEAALGELAISEVRSMLHYDADAPLEVLGVFKHRHAIPQYEASSAERFAARQAVEEQYPGLFIAGNLSGGIGMVDRIKQGTAVARQILTGTHSRKS